MADTVDGMIQLFYNQDSDKARFKHTVSNVTVNEVQWVEASVNTNSITAIGSLGLMGTSSTTNNSTSGNTGRKLIGIQVGSTQIVNIRFNGTSATGQLPLNAGGMFLADSTSLTGLHVANPSATNAAKVRVAVFDA